ncbi:hypothetical protein RHGRI_038151 [Rhododendron griersonianum]|uniref:Non-structural maintenance of chromosomes element 1 homolog n=1 Tax=Rhododendron griersonianum TaxID=479676 RepID=A0AAV6HV70_9ERIC|nr:hypothetical protein RHGRI_038151 [Rhododendron griersonianum]
MPSLCWKHHTLIQALMSRGPLNEQDFHSIFTGVTGKNPGTHQQLFNDYLLKINKELSFVQMELRACRNQYDGSVFYGVVNNVADEQSKLGTRYTVPQIAFYKGIIEAIAHDALSNGCISNIDALNIRLENQVLWFQLEQGPTLRLLLPTFLLHSRTFLCLKKRRHLKNLYGTSGYVSLQMVTSDLVLDPSLISAVGSAVMIFPRVKSAMKLELRYQVSLFSQADPCQNEGCTVRIHHYCLKRKFSRTKGEKVCPGCSTPWPLPAFKTEAVEEEEADANGTTQSQPPLGPSSRKRTRTSRGGDSGTLNISSQPPVPTSDVKRATRSSARLR